MKIVSKELSTSLTAMPIEYGEELDLELWLLVAVGLDAWFLQIKYNTYTVFIVVPYQPIVSVGSIGDHVGLQYFL